MIRIILLKDELLLKCYLWLMTIYLYQYYKAEYLRYLYIPFIISYLAAFLSSTRIIPLYFHISEMAGRTDFSREQHTVTPNAWVRTRILSSAQSSISLDESWTSPPMALRSVINNVLYSKVKIKLELHLSSSTPEYIQWSTALNVSLYLVVKRPGPWP